jgi:hypothetical protein
MMITHPTREELLEAVSQWLAADQPDTGAFQMRLARNAIDTVRRELALGDQAESAAAIRIAHLLGREGDFAMLNAGLADAIRDGTVAWHDVRLLDHLRATALDMLAIDQPRYAHDLDGEDGDGSR